METSAVTVFGSSFTVDGKYLLCSNSLGRVGVWNLDYYLFQNSEWVQRTGAENSGQSKESGPDTGYVFQAHDSPIYSLAVTDSLLITGADEEIRGWKQPWQGSSGKQNEKAFFELRTPQLEGLKGSLSPWAETNGLAIDSKTAPKNLFSAAGDGYAYSWDLETQKVVQKFAGHGDYLHAITLIPGSQLLATGSEDGTCRLWDIRTNECVETFPIDETSSRDKFVAATTVDHAGNWLCFGGQDSKGRGSFNTVHVASRTVMTKALTDPSISCVQSLQYCYSEGENGTVDLVCGGDSLYLEYWDKMGKSCQARLKTSSPSIYTLNQSPSEKTNVLVSGGTAPFVDVIGVGTRTHMLSFFMDGNMGIKKST
mmetsp:Transcript_3406/g.4578  ORF Transcript_3406/g.4578 Transcript_3406/m.4578 type:complete len:368 (-) Transcript_3406:1800-2903(-)